MQWWESWAKIVRYWDKRCAHCVWDPWQEMVSKFPGRSYQWEELEGTPLKRKLVVSHVKRFYARVSTTFDKTAEPDGDLSGSGENSSGSDLAAEVFYDAQSLAEPESGIPRTRIRHYRGALV